MRIVQVCPYSMERRGGVQSHVRDLTAWLISQGHDVVVVAPGPSATTEAAVLPAGRHVMIGLSDTRFEVSWIGGRALSRLMTTISSETVDVVHVHTPFVPFLAARVWRALRKPIVATFHATLPPHDRLMRCLLAPIARRMRDRATRTIAVSSSAADLLGGTTEFNAILPPAIQLAAWRAAGDARSRRSSRRTVVFLGRWEERKGLSVLIEAWPTILAGLGAEHPHLVIAGGGTLAPIVRALAVRHPDHVTIVDHPDAATARTLVANADLVVAPAIHGESFGLVIVEALAAGTPVVAAANAGYSAVLAGGGERMLTPPGDPAALARKVVELLTDAAQVDELCRWGRAHVEAFDVAAVGPEILRLYAEALDGSRRQTDRNGTWSSAA